MKVIAIREAKQKLSATVDECQKEGVIITRHGRPAAVLIGVAGQEMEEVMLRNNPRFWEMIRTSRRSRKRYSAAEVRKRLEADVISDKKPPRKKATH